MLTAPYLNHIPNLGKHVIYDNSGILALNKPAGWVVHGAYGGECSIVDFVDQLQCPEWPDQHRIVHRLDRFTTGVLLMARTKAMSVSLAKAFEARSIKKEYWALVDGTPNSSGTVNCPIVQDGMFMGVGEGGKQAITHYKKLGANQNGISFILMKPQTGRRHQLRVHTALVLGMPILGDRDYHPYYHDRTRLRIDRPFAASAIPKEVNARMQGQVLHAFSVTLEHPLLGEEITISANLPDERVSVWADLGFDVPAAA